MGIIADLALVVFSLLTQIYLHITILWVKKAVSTVRLRPPIPFSNLEMYFTTMSSQHYSVAFCLYDNGEIYIFFFLHKLEARFLFHSSTTE